jgi:hypothetical protein
MIIANIETFPLRIPFKSGTQAAASAWGDKGLPVADSLLVRVTTDQGLEGWGATFGFRAVSSAQLAIDELIAPLVTAALGTDPMIEWRYFDLEAQRYGGAISPKGGRIPVPQPQARESTRTLTRFALTCDKCSESNTRTKLPARHKKAQGD